MIDNFVFYAGDDKTQEQFQLFFKEFNLLPLFSDAHRTGDIAVRLPDIQSVLNNKTYAKELKEFSNILDIVGRDGKRNQNFNETIFRIIYNVGTFQKMMNRIKKFNNEYKNTALGLAHNFWNIVHYTDDLINM